MTISPRLQSEWRRLYRCMPAADHADEEDPGLISAEGRVRALVLSLARPAEWPALARVWQGVQADLQLPPPAIAVSGTDAYQLWFSLAEPVPVAEAHGFLAALQARYLADVTPQRIDLWPDPDGARHADPVPAERLHSEVWSAFVAPDLAPMFEETPWLDFPPNPEGQADLLSRFGSIRMADFRQAVARLQAVETPELPVAASDARALSPASADARRFLLQVMNDDSVALALRIEAAKALLMAERR